ncbi:MAG: hypothetical protein GY849_15615, partial [Deltaproteobacteria bacterium]|nr:hypothetical protein [Deltaproteobacteria bacterium]
MTCDHHNRPGGFSIILLLFPLFLALAFSIYSNILSAPFLYDDVVFRYDPIVHIGSLSQLLDILFDWDVSRRVGFITFAFNFYVDGLNPFGYHLFNIIIHALTALVLFFVTLKTLTLPSISGRWKARAPRIALLGSLIWLVHPVQIMAVSYTVQRFASLAALFFLLSILCYILGRLRQRKSRLTFFALSFLCGLAALGSKENAAMLPFVILLYEFFFFMNLSFKENRRKVLAAAIVVGLLALLLTILIVGPDVATMIEKGMAKKGMTLFERVMTQFRVVVLYLTLLIFPHPSRLNVDYDFALSRGLFNPPSTFLSLLLLTGLLAFALFRAKKNPLFSFSLLWFFANLAIESSVFPLDMVYEHRLYLPSMGPIMLFAGCIAAFEHPLLKKAGILMGILIALLFSYWTYERNRIWQDPVTLWE